LFFFVLKEREREREKAQSQNIISSIQF